MNAGALPAETLRIASWNSQLKRDGPGLLLRDILRGKDAQIDRAVFQIGAVKPDILVLLNFDYDANLAAAQAFADRLRAVGVDFPYAFSRRPNTGRQFNYDVNGDGYQGDAVDAQGYGKFSGQGGMLILSSKPFAMDGVRDFSDLLWRDLPGNMQADEPELAGLQRLSSVGHWIVPVILGPNHKIELGVWHATAPVFDGDTERNDRRNRDENVFWARLLDGQLASPPPSSMFVLAGASNIDPFDGEGFPEGIGALLNHPKLFDARPQSRGAIEAAQRQGGANARHRGDPALDTSDWKDNPGPGNLRVQYILPSATLDVVDAGVYWPASNEEGAEVLAQRPLDQSWHGMVWVDLRIE